MNSTFLQNKLDKKFSYTLKKALKNCSLTKQLHTGFTQIYKIILLSKYALLNP